MVFVGVVVDDARQTAVVVVIIKLGRERVVRVGLEVEVEFASPCIHATVRAALTGGEGDIVQREGIVVVSMKEIGEERSPNPISALRRK